jgi:putative FmdB family regulatory protein
MPTYEFRCPNGHVFDRFFSKISDSPSDVTCPDCGEMAHRQISGGAGLVFKGSGFYLTDYGKNAHRGSAPKPADSKGGDAKSSSSDAKPAADGGGKSSEASASTGSTKSESKPDKPSGAKSDGGSGSKKPGGSDT